MTASVIAVEDSENKKLGKCSATYVSQDSCPTTCAFLHNGCYAEYGPIGIHTARLNKSPRESTKIIAQQEAEAIASLSGRKPLRLHVEGHKVKNLCAKTVKPEDAYEVWQAGDWTWYVLKKWQVDDDKPYARWFCQVVTPMTGPNGDWGDVYVKEIKQYARRIK